MTLMKIYGDFQKGQYQEKNLRYGVREHGMGAIANGIALHNPGMIPYCATFFNFTDYMRGAIRMAALSRVSSIQCRSQPYCCTCTHPPVTMYFHVRLCFAEWVHCLQVSQ